MLLLRCLTDTRRETDKSQRPSSTDIYCSPNFRLNMYLTAQLKCTVDVNMAVSSSKSSCVNPLEEAYCLLEAGFFDENDESEKSIDTSVSEITGIVEITVIYVCLSCGKVCKSNCVFARPISIKHPNSSTFSSNGTSVDNE